MNVASVSPLSVRSAKRTWSRFKRGLAALAPKWGYVLGRRLFHGALLYTGWPQVPYWALSQYMRRQEFCLSKELADLPVKDGEPRFEIHMMLCEGHVVMAEWAIWSFVRYVEVPYKIIVHDDGSLTYASVSRLKVLFPCLTVLSREETDARAQQYFEGLPLCREARTQFDFSLKLFNLGCTAGTRSILMLDSDVITVARPVELLEALEQPKSGLLYNEHFREPLETIASEFRLPDLQARVERACETRVQPLFNSGVMSFNKDEILDYAVIERWLGRMKDQGVTIPILSEQTLFGMLAHRSGRAQPLPEDYRVGRGAMKLRGTHPDTKMFHFMASTKNYFFSLGVPAALRAEGAVKNDAA